MDIRRRRRGLLRPRQLGHGHGHGHGLLSVASLPSFSLSFFRARARILFAGQRTRASAFLAPISDACTAFAPNSVAKRHDGRSSVQLRAAENPRKVKNQSAPSRFSLFLSRVTRLLFLHAAPRK